MSIKLTFPSSWIFSRIAKTFFENFFERYNKSHPVPEQQITINRVYVKKIVWLITGSIACKLHSYQTISHRYTVISIYIYSQLFSHEILQLGSGTERFSTFIVILRKICHPRMDFLSPLIRFLNRFEISNIFYKWMKIRLCNKRKT